MFDGKLTGRHSQCQCVAVCCSECVAVCCSVLQCQCVAVCCSVVQCVAACWACHSTPQSLVDFRNVSVLPCVAVCCSECGAAVQVFDCKLSGRYTAVRCSECVAVSLLQ